MKLREQIRILKITGIAPSNIRASFNSLCSSRAIIKIVQPYQVQLLKEKTEGTHGNLHSLTESPRSERKS